MLKNKITWVMPFICGLCLSGCGGGSKSEEVIKSPVASTPAKMLSVSGKAIDGYIVGGTVFLDINGNGVADEVEPQKLTEELGDYRLDVSEEHAYCLAYSAIIVDVPVGAIDEGSQEEGVERHEVTEPYQIVLQPTFEPITEADFSNGLIRDISPLTTLVWQTIERNFPAFVESEEADPNDATSNAKHCDYLQSHNDLVTELKQEIESTVGELVYFYNLSADQIYADFIANSDSDSFHAAQDIMKGLKAAYQHKTQLRSEHPDASSIAVFVYRDSQEDEFNNIENGWYRHQDLRYESEDFFETVKLKESETLSEVDYVMTRLHELGLPWNDTSINGWLSVRTDIGRQHNGDKTQYYYSCGSIERVSFDVDGVHYELGNVSDSEQQYQDAQVCNNNNTDTPFERNYSLRYQEGEVDYGAEFFFRQQQSRFFELEQWVGFSRESALDPQEMIDTLAALPYKWDDEVLIDTAYWRKGQSSGNISIDTDDQNNWRRSTRHDDGTISFECSNDGETWLACSE